MHTIGLIAAVLSIIAAWMAARLLRNWRHPIMLMGALSCVTVAAIAVDAHEVQNVTQDETRSEQKIDVARMFIDTYERLRHEQETQGTDSRAATSDRDRSL